MPRFKVLVTVNKYETAYVTAEDEAKAKMLINDALSGDEDAQEEVSFDSEGDGDFSFGEITVID